MTEKNDQEKKENFFKRKVKFRIWFPLVFVFSLIVLVVSCFVYCDSFNLGCLNKNNFNYTFKPKEELVPCPMDGVYTTEEKARRRPIAVMVENHADSRPHSGISQASIVYETVTEGGITRFMVVFVENDVGTVGPVRSARPFFVEMADELNAYYSHCGGSSEGLSLIDSLSNFYDLDHFRHPGTFWRDKTRPAPHNLYTSTEKVRKEGKKIAPPDAAYGTWSFKEDLPEEERKDGQRIKIDFSSYKYQVEYSYKKKTNTYRRQIAGKDHIDSNNGKTIEVTNLIVQYTDISYYKGTRKTNIRTTGEGKALIFIDGKKINARWKKIGRKGRTRYFSLKGEEIKFNRGMIWVEMISSQMKVTSNE